MWVLRAEESTNSSEREDILQLSPLEVTLCSSPKKKLLGGNSKKKLKILFVKVDCLAVAIFLREKMQQKSIGG